MNLPFVNPHFLQFINIMGWCVLSGLYLLIFSGLVRSMIDRPLNRTFIVGSIAGLFLFVGLMFAGWAVYRYQNGAPFFLESFIVMSAATPALFFLYALRKQRLSFSLDEYGGASLVSFNRLKHEFVSVASHELRTPLSVINGFAEILVREKLGPLNDEQKRRVRKILMQGQRLNRIIDELLDLSRVRSGKISMRSDVFDLIPVLKASLDDQKIVCEQNKIELIDELPDVLPDVIADIDRVTQVVVNMVNNAVKYTGVGGKVGMKAFHDVSKRQVRVEVWDTGIGIAPEDQQRIFREFYRAIEKHEKKYEGSGLGLAIVKQLVETMGGKVGLYSEGLGKGSTFFFTLPLARRGSVLKKPAKKFLS